MDASQYRFIRQLMGHCNYDFRRLKDWFAEASQAGYWPEEDDEWYRECQKEIIKMEIECLSEGISLRAYLAIRSNQLR